MGGTNDEDNLVYLTPEHHFFAHRLLVKMYPGHIGIATAAVMMSGRKQYGHREYAWVKRTMSEAQKKRMQDPAVRARVSACMSKAMKGRVKDPEWEANRIAGMRTQEARDRMSRAIRGQKRTPEQIERIRESQLNMSPEAKLARTEKCRAAMTGQKRTPEQIERMRQAQQRRRSQSA